jgi:hypothetical protein
MIPALRPTFEKIPSKERDQGLPKCYKQPQIQESQPIIGTKSKYRRVIAGSGDQIQQSGAQSTTSRSPAQPAQRKGPSPA